MALAHHTLVAWQRADDLFLKLHQLSLKAFPAFEKYELGGQLRRSAFSVPVNIVEGFATKYRKRRLNFLNVAQSSLAETGYCVHAARRLEYIDQKTATELDLEIRPGLRPARRPDRVRASETQNRGRRRHRVRVLAREPAVLKGVGIAGWLGFSQPINP